ncbi:MAG TPA: hypothetical protein VHS09_13540, partial [Polyangiaceae bacterium]|nr:hypothetical protein [Polyangiaceae bacterium]
AITGVMVLRQRAAPAGEVLPVETATPAVVPVVAATSAGPSPSPGAALPGAASPLPVETASAAPAETASAVPAETASAAPADVPREAPSVTASAEMAAAPERTPPPAPTLLPLPPRRLTKTDLLRSRE